MFKKSLTAMVLAATAITGFSAAPAAARHNDNGYYNNSRYDNGRYDNGRYSRSYDNRRQDYRRDSRNYRNNRCDSGTGGTIIGAAAGGLAGNEVARRGDKTEGAIIGAILGGLAGRAIDKSGNSRRC